MALLLLQRSKEQHSLQSKLYYSSSVQIMIPANVKHTHEHETILHILEDFGKVQLRISV